MGTIEVGQEAVLWKTGTHISVVYRSGGYTHNLHVSDFSLDASMERIVLSMDLSENERARNKDTNRYLDAKELLERYSEVKQIQIYREKRLEPFEAWCTGYPNAFVELEFRFDKGITHRVPCDVQIDERNLWFYVWS